MLRVSVGCGKDAERAATHGSALSDCGGRGESVMRGDVVGRLDVRRELEKARRLLSFLSDNAREAVVVLQGGTIRFCNARAAELSGVPVAQLAGREFRGFVHPDDLPFVDATHEQRLKRKDVPRTYMVRVRDLSGAFRWLELNAALVEWEGAPAVLAFLTDVSERVHVEERLREGNERFRMLFEQSRDATYISTRDGRFADVNPAMLRLLGYEQEEMRGLDLVDVAAEPADCREFLAAVEQQGFVDDRPLKLRRKDGRLVDCLVSATVRRSADDAVAGYQGFARDISEQRHAYERLQEVFIDLVETTARMMETVDPYTAEHQRRVARIADMVGRKLSLDDERLQGLYIGAMLHDIGKLAVPVTVLTKPGRLTANEWNLLRSHSVRGYEILKEASFPWPVAEMALSHHERLDGSGYPHGLRGTQLQAEVLILGACDVLEAMSSFRPYRPALSRDVVVAELREGRSVRYSADVVDALLELIAQDAIPLGVTYGPVPGMP